jgi:hypothetical protein
MFKKITSVLSAAILLAAGISAVGITSASAANEKTLTIASKVKGVTATLGTPSGYGGNPMGSVYLTASQAADTSNSGNFVTEFIPTDSQASVVVALYPNATFGMGNPSNFPGSYTYNGTDAVSNNQLFVIKVTQANNMSYQYYEVAVRIVSTDATLSFANSRLKSVTLGSATAFTDIAQLASSNNRTGITLTSAQASSTAGDQMTYFSGAGNNSVATAKKFASSVSSLDSNTFSSATTVTRLTAITNGDFIVIKVIAEDTTTTKYYGYTVTVSSSGGGVGGGGGGGGITAGTVGSITSTGATFSFADVMASNPPPLDLKVFAATGSTSTALQSTPVASNAVSAAIVGLSPGTSYRISLAVRSNGTILGLVSFTTLGSSGPTQEEIAAEAQAAAIEAERVRQVAIAAAKVALEGVLKGDKPGTLAQFKDANYAISSEEVLTRVNAELLKLSADDRIKSVEINKVIKVESFIVQISTTETQNTITANQLVSVGLLAATNLNKMGLTAALKNRTASTLDSMEKIAAAIAEETAVIKARAARLDAIKAKVSSRKG